jgi:aryl sulfotransferase
MNEPITWPRKLRELHNHHFDSTIRNDFKFRDDDIIIGTYAKSGTTWVQQIVTPRLVDLRSARLGKCVSRRRHSYVGT